jgi:SAM-dependent methyltransferase
MLTPYNLMYRLGLAPWERRPVSATWERIIQGPPALLPGRALDVGCGSGRDAVYLAKRGWQVTAVDLVPAAIAKARERAAREGADVEWITGDVSDLPGLGLKPGYTLLYDFGCVQGLSDAARRGAAAGMTALAAPGATLLVVAFAPGRRVLLPRGMSEEDVSALFGGGWKLEAAEPAADSSSPPPVRRARPTAYRLTRVGSAAIGQAS